MQEMESRGLPTTIPEGGYGWVTSEPPTPKAKDVPDSMAVEDEEEEGEVKGEWVERPIILPEMWMNYGGM